MQILVYQDGIRVQFPSQPHRFVRRRRTSRYLHAFGTQQDPEPLADQGHSIAQEDSDRLWRSLTRTGNLEDFLGTCLDLTRAFRHH